MTKTNDCEQRFLDLLFLNTDFAAVGDAAGLQNSAAAGSLYISLHTADPGETGAQTTSETSYTGYARVAVARSGAGWSRSGSVMSNVADIVFGACTAGSATITHIGIGTDASGAGVLLYKVAATASLAVSAGITPRIVAGALTITED